MDIQNHTMTDDRQMSNSFYTLFHVVLVEGQLITKSISSTSILCRNFALLMKD